MNPMQIFGREVPSPEALWNLYGRLTAFDELWHQETFAETARLCGLKRVSERKSGYFSFAAFPHTTGQAPIAETLIEEIRLFIGQEPRDIPASLWERDQDKHKPLARQYAKMFETRLGSPRIVNDNKIFESTDFRVRVLVGPPVWVVISSFAIIKRLPNDWWSTH